MSIDRPPPTASIWPNIRLAMLAFVACVAGLVGYVAFGMTYMYVGGTSLTPRLNDRGNTLYIDEYLGGEFDFVLVALYCFAVGIGAIYYLGRLAPLAAGVLLVVAGAMVAWAVNPIMLQAHGWYLPSSGAFGGAVSASIIVPCIYLHLHGVLGHSDRRQFSLRALLLAVVVVSVLFGGLTIRRQYHDYRQQQIMERSRSEG